MNYPTEILLNPPTNLETVPPSSDCVASSLNLFKKGENAVIEKILEKSYIAPDCMIGKDLNSTRIPKDELDNVASNIENVKEKEQVCVELDSKYPLKLNHDEVMGRSLVAARDIEHGEIFLKDWPIITAPNAGENSTTCLGCCFIVPDLQACQKCGWPVCSDKCSELYQHAEFECKIFSKENIRPNLPSPYSYIASAEYIKILRCLLLKQEDCPEKMEKWKQILSLEAHMDLRRHIPKVQFMSGLIRRFVKCLCKLTMFEDSMIEFALGVVDVNAFRHSLAPIPIKSTLADADKTHTKNATFLYPQASMAAHGCIRNTDWKTLEGGQLEMRASHRISQGQVILHAYVDLMLGTPERRRLLRSLFYFDCTCSRCSDPTEINTYFSALKCTNCKDGYLLAENPLEYKSNWVCNSSNSSNTSNCTEVKSYQYERELTQQILAEENQVCKQIPNQTNLITIKQLMKILKKHRNVTVHPNHYRVISLEYTLARHLFQINKPPVEIMLEIKRLIKHHMMLSAVFHPCADDNSSKHAT